MSVLAECPLQSGDYETAASTYYILSAVKPGIIALTTDAFNMAGETDSALVYYNKIVPKNPYILCKPRLCKTTTFHGIR